VVHSLVQIIIIFND